jgi:ribosomal protein S12 methylthiotransferase
VEVLIEGTHADTDLLLRGRLSTQAPEVDGSVLVNDGTAAPGTFVTCQVTDAHPYDLVARIV